MLLVLVVLAVSVVAVAVVFILSFVDVAFGTAQGEPAPSAGTSNWHPPLVLGKRLFNWASGVVRRALPGALGTGAWPPLRTSWSERCTKAQLWPSIRHGRRAMQRPPWGARRIFIQ